MKKLIAIILAAMVLCSCILSGCGIVSEEDKLLLNQNRICVETSKEVFEYIKDHDTEKLIELFSEESAEKHDLEKEIENMYEFIDGDFESYESISDPGTGETVTDGKIVRLNGAPWINGIKTTTGP